jgi:hypothetical protein
VVPKNKQRRKELNDAWKEKQKLLFQEWKAQQFCKVCGENNSVCLDFHHLDPTQKEYTIGSLSSKIKFEKLLLEIDKCVVLCANCHRKVHANLISL